MQACLWPQESLVSRVSVLCLLEFIVLSVASLASCALALVGRRQVGIKPISPQFCSLLKWVLATPLSRVQNSHVVKLVWWDILQCDWSWWNSTSRTKLWIGLIPDFLPGNGRGRRRPTTLALSNSRKCWYKESWVPSKLLPVHDIQTALGRDSLCSQRLFQSPLQLLLLLDVPFTHFSTVCIAGNFRGTTNILPANVPTLPISILY